MGLDVEVGVQEENIPKQKVEIGRCGNHSQSHKPGNSAGRLPQGEVGAEW